MVAYEGGKADEEKGSSDSFKKQKVEPGDGDEEVVSTR